MSEAESESMMGVCYRTGKLTVADYDEAIRDLQAARDQIAEGSLMGCDVCGDSGHAPQDECHHDPLILARRWAAAGAIYKCWHCGYVATNEEQARAHFGANEFEPAACQDASRPSTHEGLREALRLVGQKLMAIEDTVPIAKEAQTLILKALAATPTDQPLREALEECREYAFHHLHCARNQLENGPHGLKHKDCDCGWTEVDARIAQALSSTNSPVPDGEGAVPRVQLKQIGYISWIGKEARPPLGGEEVHTLPLTDADIEAGYVQQALYIDENETPPAALKDREG